MEDCVREGRGEFYNVREVEARARDGRKKRVENRVDNSIDGSASNPKYVNSVERVRQKSRAAHGK